MLLDKQFSALANIHASLIEASMDPLAIVSQHAELVFVNKPMSVFLEAAPRTLKKCPKFCDLVKLDLCKNECCLEQALGARQTFRVNETPALRGKERLRLSLRLVPFAPELADVVPTGCGFLTLRDSTAEVVVQAKFHRAVELLRARDENIEELKDKILVLQKSLREAALSRVGK